MQVTDVRFWIWLVVIQLRGAWIYQHYFKRLSKFCGKKGRHPKTDDDIHQCWSQSGFYADIYSIFFNFWNWTNEVRAVFPHDGDLIVLKQKQEAYLCCDSTILWVCLRVLLYLFIDYLWDCCMKTSRPRLLSTLL